MKGIGGHHRAYEGRTNDWITPPGIIRRIGPFDLDPCGCPGSIYPTARTTYYPEDDGLSRDWFGRVFVNPPYGPHTKLWLDRLAAHRDGVALIFARTETRSFFDHVWKKADCILFVEGRLNFLRPDGSRTKGNAGGPSVLIGYGSENVDSLATCMVRGSLVKSWRVL